VTPLPYGGSRVLAGLEDDEPQAAFGQLRGGGEADRAGADDHDGQGLIRAGGLGGGGGRVLAHRTDLLGISAA
jgi:hypothetical protein